MGSKDTPMTAVGDKATIKELSTHTHNRRKA